MKNHLLALSRTNHFLQLHQSLKLAKFNFLTLLFLFLYRLLKDTEKALIKRQSSVCETELAALKLKQEACQFGHFLQAKFQWKNGLPALFLIFALETCELDVLRTC